MRIFISIDIEGVAGVTGTSHTVPGGHGYTQACQWMTAEVAAAVEGARAAGATDFIIADGHGGADNLDLDALPSDVEIVRSWPRPMAMMQGVDENCDIAFCLGYHTGGHEVDGVLSHTFRGMQISYVKINDQMASELTVNAAIAGHYGVPVLLVSGDKATCHHAETLLGTHIATAQVKKEYSRLSARTLTPSAACRLIQQKAEQAIKNRSDDDFRLSGPLHIQMGLKHHWTAELLSYLPFITRISAYEIEFEAKDIIEATSIFHFITSYTPLPPSV
ncbi:MAG: M55 family metallopeptidase [Pseudomonadota bacterium]